MPVARSGWRRPGCRPRPGPGSSRCWARTVADDRLTRLTHAGGKSYLDLLRRRAGDASDAPDAVLAPGSTEEVSALLHACSELGVVVVPFGGGTSVVGGLAGTDADDRPVVCLDLRRMAR